MKKEWIFIYITKGLSNPIESQLKAIPNSDNKKMRNKITAIIDMHEYDLHHNQARKRKMDKNRGGIHFTTKKLTNFYKIHNFSKI